MIARYQESTYAKDIDAYLGCFAEDAEMIDVLRSFVGHDAIRPWALREVTPNGETFAHSKVLAEMGLEVLVGGRDPAAVEAAARESSGYPIVLDVADPASVAHTTEDIGQVDVLINNAGVLATGGVLDSVAEWERSMAVMVDGLFRLMRNLIPNRDANGILEVSTPFNVEGRAQAVEAITIPMVQSSTSGNVFPVVVEHLKETVRRIASRMAFLAILCEART